MIARAVTIALGLACAATGATAGEGEDRMTRIEIRTPDAALTATLDDSAAGRDFAAMLPLELTLRDYHGIEKIADLPRAIDRAGAPERYAPEVGDLTVYAPWGNLAIFYRPFEASRGLVRLGAIDGPLDALLSGGEVPVTIAVAD